MTAMTDLRYYCQQLLLAQDLDNGIPGCSPRQDEIARVKDYLRDYPADQVKAMLNELRK